MTHLVAASLQGILQQGLWSHGATGNPSSGPGHGDADGAGNDDESGDDNSRGDDDDDDQAILLSDGYDDGACKSPSGSDTPPLPACSAEALDEAALVLDTFMEAKAEMELEAMVAV